MRCWISLLLLTVGVACRPARPAAAKATTTTTAATVSASASPAERERQRRDAGRLAMLVLALRTAATADEPEPEPEPEPKDPTETMKQLYENGQDAYEEGDYSVAFESFLAAYDAKPAASLLYNAAVCLEKLEDYWGASDLFEQYLEVSPMPRDREAVEARILALRDADHS
jgi:tetratricopeptide (TPR) repeat protein